ncbi:MAG TPA: hypothetical protein EYP53_04125 [Candidatus Latescibacteria bacterium]|nr:hypothetical protein [Candidatus Latescibacterota bacterium]
MRFIVDDMLGRLAKWLRILGYDTCYCRRISDAELLRRAAAEHRIILTRDTRLIERIFSGNYLLIKSEDLRGQLRQVLGELNLDTRRYLFSRCLVCNHPILPVEPEEVRGRVPSYVFQTQTEFSTCPGCERIYWKGTHYERILETLKQIEGDQDEV